MDWETALEIAAIAPEMPLVMCTLYGSELVRQQALGVWDQSHSLER
ncbi:MAG: hypothetical protein NVS9B5_10360 [Terriglobales bacterium]